MEDLDWLVRFMYIMCCSTVVVNVFDLVQKGVVVDVVVILVGIL
jgi:hypothetical protein